jgi:hypothetical protein
MRNCFFIIAMLCGLLARPAVASTVPPMNVPASRGVLALGALLDISVDYAMTDRWTLGFSGRTFLFALAAVRSSYSLGEGPWHTQLGLTCSAGIFGVPPQLPGGILPSLQGSFIQPALALAIPVWLGCPMWFRATLGPTFIQESDVGGELPSGFPRESFGLLFLPNLELAFPLGDEDELTIGGNSLVGWRRLL